MSHPYVTGMLVEQHLDNLRNEADRYRLARSAPRQSWLSRLRRSLASARTAPAAPAAPTRPAETVEPAAPIIVPAERPTVPGQRAGSPEYISQEEESGVSR